MKKNLFYLIAVLLVLFFIELVLRLAFPLPELSNFNRINYQILDRQDDYSGYLRNIKMSWKSSLDTNYTFEHQLNTYGYRDNKEWPIQKKKDKRIFMVGDSFVEGMMSTQDKTIPLSFEEQAEESGLSVEVFNCGMMGIGINEYIKFLKDAVPIFQPDEVIMVLYSNDAPFQRQYLPTERMLPLEYSFWTPRLLTLIRQIKADDPIPFSMMPEDRPFYKAVPDPGNPWTFNEASLKNDVTPQIADAMKKGDFNYFRTNWILEEEKFLKSPIDVQQRLSFLVNYLNNYQCKLTVFYIPSRSQVSNYYYQFEKQACLQKCPDFIDLTTPTYQQHAITIGQNCAALGVPFKDFTPLIRKKEQEGNHLYWDYDDHMRGNSYVMLGREIFNFWLQTNNE